MEAAAQRLDFGDDHFEVGLPSRQATGPPSGGRDERQPRASPRRYRRPRAHGDPLHLRRVLATAAAVDEFFREANDV